MMTCDFPLPAGVQYDGPAAAGPARIHFFTGRFGTFGVKEEHFEADYVAAVAAGLRAHFSEAATLDGGAK